MKPAEAIVLVGGLGTRLRDLVSDVPKPLAPVAGRPFLAWVLDQLASGGIDRVVLAAGYMAEKVQAVVGSQWRGMVIEYSVETHALGTGGAVSRARTLLRGSAAHVINGDTFVRYRPDTLAQTVDASGAVMGIALAHVPDVARYGAVECASGRVVGFREKGESGAGLINAGCYYMTAAAFAAMPTEECFSLERRVLLPLVMAGQVAGYSQTEGFIDIGVPEDYMRAQTLFGEAA